MKVRIAPLPAIGSLIVLLGAYAAVARGGGGLDDGTPIIVGNERVSSAIVERQAAELARGEAERLPTARVWVGDRIVEELWLRGEAAERGLTVEGRGLAGLRSRVADTIAADARGDRQLLSEFQSFHRRWRARTSCAPSVHDAYADRCSNHSPASDGGCRWMGRASLCWATTKGRRLWLVVETRGDRALRRLRTRSKRAAVAKAADLYRASRARRDEAERAATGARRRAAARRRATLAQEARMVSLAHGRRRAIAARRKARVDQARRRAQAARRRRQRLTRPELSLPTLRRARAVCRRYRADIDPYLFGAGLQDLSGQAEGFAAARRGAAKRLPRAAVDSIDRAKVARLVRQMRQGDRHLRAIDRAVYGRDLEHAYAELSLFDAAARGDARLAARLGLKDCLPSPTS